MNILLASTRSISPGHLRDLLEKNNLPWGIATCTGLDVLEVTNGFIPDIALIETGALAPESLGILKYLQKINRSVYAIITAAEGDSTGVEQALAAGAADFIIGTPSDSELLYRIKKAACGKTKPVAASSRKRAPAPAKRRPIRKAFSAQIYRRGDLRSPARGPVRKEVSTQIYRRGDLRSPASGSVCNEVSTQIYRRGDLRSPATGPVRNEVSAQIYRRGDLRSPASGPVRNEVSAQIYRRGDLRSPARGSVRKAVGNIFFGVLLTLVAVLAFFLIQSKITGDAPSVFGYRLYVVLSGSMSPAFDTGSAVFVRPTDPDAIEVGDIVTFGSRDGGMLTTHRVVGVDRSEGLEFTTRGDANNMDDPNPVPGEHIVGRVHGSVPYLGYIMSYARTRQGLVLLIFIPSLLVLIIEVSNIIRYMIRGDQEKSVAA